MLLDGVEQHRVQRLGRQRALDDAAFRPLLEGGRLHSFVALASDHHDQHSAISLLVERRQ